MFGNSPNKPQAQHHSPERSDSMQRAIENNRQTLRFATTPISDLKLRNSSRIGFRNIFGD